jgi:hypothetical protein
MPKKSINTIYGKASVIEWWGKDGIFVKLATGANKWIDLADIVE